MGGEFSDCVLMKFGYDTIESRMKEGDSYFSITLAFVLF